MRRLTWVFYLSLILPLLSHFEASGQSLSLSGWVPSEVSFRVQSNPGKPNVLEFVSNLALKLSISELGAKSKVWKVTHNQRMVPQQVLSIDLTPPSTENSANTLVANNFESESSPRLLILQAP